MKHLLKGSGLCTLLLSLVAFGCPSPVRAQATMAKEVLPVTVFKNLKAGKPQTVVLYGTSLTIQGAWAKAVGDYFEKNFPGQVTFINSAKAGRASNWGVENLQEQVLAKNPDLVILEFAINDANVKNDVSKAKAKDNLDDMVKRLRKQNSKVDIVLQTMNLAWDSPKVPKTYGSDRPELEAYYEIYRKYAQDHDLPLVDNYPNWVKIQKEDPERYQKMVPDGIHPSSTSAMAVTWPAVEALLEKARASASAQ